MARRRSRDSRYASESTDPLPIDDPSSHPASGTECGSPAVSPDQAYSIDSGLAPTPFGGT